MDTKLIEYISALVKRNPGQMDFNEYGEVADHVSRTESCNLLVFGCGRDSPLWIRGNQGGRTTFVEHSPRWAGRATLAIQQENLTGSFSIEMVQYKTQLVNWEKDLQGDLSIPSIQRFPSDFDVVLVDAPPGAGKNAPGRLQSLYEASRLCAPKGCIYVHDMHRPVEKAAARELLVKRAKFKMTRVTQKLHSFRR